MFKGFPDQYQNLSHYRMQTCGIGMPFSSESSGYPVSMYPRLGLETLDSG